MSRKLASIQRIGNVSEIQDAQKIECLTILGWHVVSQKGLHKIGDKVVYFEIDSKMPDVPWFEDLKPYGHRIRTIKLRGQVSQGYAVPLSILNNIAQSDIELDNDKIILRMKTDVGKGVIVLREGDNVSDLLGITKYEPPIPMSLGGEVKGGFPGWISKTDETRIQSVPQLLERHKGVECYATEKLDGASCTMFIDPYDDTFNVCSREWNLRESEGNALWRAARKGDIEKKLRKLTTPHAVQGEVIGPGIQKNKYGLKEFEFRMYNAFDISSSTYLQFMNLMLMSRNLNIQMVPVIGGEPVAEARLRSLRHMFDLFKIGDHTVDQLVEFATRPSTLNPKIHAEGVVIRPLGNIQDPDVGRLSFKVINPSFLLKYQDE